MGYEAWIAVAVLGAIWLIAFFTSPDEEALRSPNPPIGTYRIRPHGTYNKFVVERYQGDWYLLDYAGYMINIYSTNSPLVFDTEEKAEIWISRRIESERLREEKAERAKEERRAFIAAHPPREVPPFKYLK